MTGDVTVKTNKMKIISEDKCQSGYSNRYTMDPAIVYGGNFKWHMPI